MSENFPTKHIPKHDKSHIFTKSKEMKFFSDVNVVGRTMNAIRIIDSIELFDSICWSVRNMSCLLWKCFSLRQSMSSVVGSCVLERVYALRLKY